MHATRRNGYCVAQAGDIGHRGPRLRCGTEAEFPIAIGSPTLDASGLQQRTSVREASRNRCGPGNILNISRSTETLDACSPKLPSRIVSPTFDRARFVDCTGMILAGTQTYDVRDIENLRRSGSNIAGRDDPIAHLPHVLLSPTLYGAISDRCACVILPDGEHWGA